MRGLLLTTLLVALPLDARAQTSAPDLAAAKATVDAIYASLPRNDAWRMGPFTPDLKRLLQRDAAASEAKGEAGAIDSVPFCSCQDFAETYGFTATLAAAGPDKATATVAVRNGGPPRRVVVQLVRLGSGWAVDDVANPDLPSLKAALRESLAN